MMHHVSSSSQRGGARFLPFVMAACIAISSGCGPGRAHSSSGSADKPLDCLVVSVFPYPEDEDVTYFEKLHRYFEDMTGQPVDFRYVDKRVFSRGADTREVFRRVLIDAIEDTHPPDIILNAEYSVINDPTILDSRADLLCDVSELSAQHAPTVYRYLQSRDVVWNHAKPMLIPVRRRVPSVDVWLVRDDIRHDTGGHELTTIEDMIDYLSQVKSEGLYRYPGAYLGTTATDFVPLLYPQLFGSIGEVRNSGIYRAPEGTEVFTIFDSYPEQLHEACVYSQRTLREMLFTFGVSGYDDFNARLLSGDWAAAMVPLNLRRSIDFARLFEQPFSGSVQPVRLQQEALLTAFTWPSDVGILLPANSGRCADAMRFLEAINATDHVEAAYYGVPGKQYRKAESDSYTPLVHESKFKDFSTNPYIFMALQPEPLLFEIKVPQAFRDLIKDHHAVAQLESNDPLEGFVFNPADVSDAYGRYRSDHKQAFDRLLRTNYEVFDTVFADFRASAEADYRQIRNEMQRQIDAYLHSR